MAGRGTGSTRKRNALGMIEWFVRLSPAGGRFRFANAYSADAGESMTSTGTVSPGKRR